MGISSDDTNVAVDLSAKLVGRLLEPAWGRLSDENRGDFPLREGVPRGVVEDGLPCMFMSRTRDFREVSPSPSRLSGSNGVGE